MKRWLWILAAVIILAIAIIDKVKQPHLEKQPDVAKRQHLFLHGTVKDNGIVKDTVTGLEWLTGPNIDITYAQARSWVQRLQSGNGGGWRMPTLDELESLKEVGSGNERVYRYVWKSLLKDTGRWVWSGETDSSSKAWVFHFYSGGRRSFFFRDTSNVFRAFAVRSLGDG